MDKYEFNIKVEQIKKLVGKEDYDTAMKIADTIDWKRVRNANLLSMISQVYAKNGDYQEAKDILLLAFERAPVGKRFLYRLTELALMEGNIAEAEAYFREFCDLAPEDSRQHLLRYMILKEKGAPLEQLIHTLERYNNIELDEKWLYELAELYQQAGMKSECARVCDKIMLMFGIGQYVDKAMELKMQFAPLSNYQMDLVENRDKYEAKLKKVEQKYDVISPIEEEEETGYLDDEEDEPYVNQSKVRNSIREAQAQERLAREMARIPESQYRNNAEVSDPTRVLSSIRNIQLDPDLGLDLDIPMPKAAVKPSRPEPPVYHARPEMEIMDEPEPITVSELQPLDDMEEFEEFNAADEILHSGVAEKTFNHLMIEADTTEDGLELAVQALKKIHEEIGITHSVAKITGEKFNKRGVQASADKLAGKDLIIEQAGDLTQNTLNDLNKLMSYDNTGMIVVLIDTPERIELLHRRNPLLSSKFECIGKQDRPAAMTAPVAAPAPSVVIQPNPIPQPVPQVQPVMQPQYAAQPQPMQQPQMQPQVEPQPAVQMQQPIMQPQPTPQPVPQVQPIPQPMPQMQPQMQQPVMQSQLAQQPVPQPAMQQQPVQVQPEPQQELNIMTEKPVEVMLDSAGKAKSEGEMSPDEFAQYACTYAGEIDCKITGKSMLALYERIEMLQEEGKPLSKENAEALIEEAADKAEKPSLGKMVKGVFSPKYDKEGLLILKESYFKTK